jgi:hypothetical protein
MLLEDEIIISLPRNELKYRRAVSNRIVHFEGILWWMFPRNELTSTEGLSPTGLFIPKESYGGCFQGMNSSTEGLSPTGLFILKGYYGGCFQGMNSQVQKGCLQQDSSF